MTRRSIFFPRLLQVVVEAAGIHACLVRLGFHRARLPVSACRNRSGAHAGRKAALFVEITYAFRSREIQSWQVYSGIKWIRPTDGAPAGPKAVAREIRN